MEGAQGAGQTRMPSMNNAEIVESIKEMMDAWNRLTAEARAMLPDATPEELFRVVSEAMNRSLR